MPVPAEEFGALNQGVDRPERLESTEFTVGTPQDTHVVFKANGCDARIVT